MSQISQGRRFSARSIVRCTGAVTLVELCLSPTEMQSHDQTRIPAPPRCSPEPKAQQHSSTAAKSTVGGLHKLLIGDRPTPVSEFQGRRRAPLQSLFKLRLRRTDAYALSSFTSLSFPNSSLLGRLSYVPVSYRRHTYLIRLCYLSC
jgi:hypothetical protein